MTQHLAGSGPGGGVARSRTGAPRHRGLRSAPHAPGLAFCSKRMVPCTGPSPFSTHTAFIAMLPRETRGGLETWESKARRRPHEPPQETTAQTEAAAPRSFYTA